MNHSASLKTAVLSFDKKIARLSLPVQRGQGRLLSFLIHSLFESEAEAHCGLLDPQQAFTVAMLRQFVRHFTAEGYRFLSSRDLQMRLCPQGKYVLLTFDDGYYNNLRALPVLEEFAVPAVFFISTDHVRYGKAFWWDALYRESRKRTRPEEEVRRMLEAYKEMKTAQIESEINMRYGKSALQPVSDLDRPFTAAELKKFSAHPLVFLGNHTRDHAILTNYSSAGLREQIWSCQEAIREISGKRPDIIAYPNGNCSSEILAAAREAGLQFGLLASAGRNRLPLKSGSDAALALRRSSLWGDRPVEAQCLAARSGVSIYRLLQRLKGAASMTSLLRRASIKRNPTNTLESALS
ncbi:MAG TPA: polysaccharide deacetylase family protein [Methylomirabilota bacterium]|nr:polysaccharide deacetylase family protein [Methylomirabilota bacterium]